MRTAKEMEAKMEEAEEVCNDTMRELWEECKPCLKNTCIKYFSRTCSSGSGMVGRQVRHQLLSLQSTLMTRQSRLVLKLACVFVCL